MNFRDTLLRLQGGPRALSGIVGGLNAREAGAHLGISTKQASNILRRLHQMGFLRRRKVSRLCLWSTRRFDITSKTCYRGYMYVYCFSKQGLSYIKWFKETKPIEDFLYGQLTYDIVSSVPEDVRSRIMKVTLLRTAYKYRGPTRNLNLFDNNAVPMADLIYQNQRLADENKKLSLENQLLRFQLKDVTDAKEQEKKMLYQHWANTLVEAAKISNEREEWRRSAGYYHAGFEVAKHIIEKTSGFGHEEFRQFRTLLSIHLWIARNNQQGIVNAEELAKFISNLGLDDVETILSLMEDGILCEPGDGKLHYAYTQPSVA